MSFWSGKNESLLQSLVETTFKAVLTGIFITIAGKLLIVMVDNQIEVAAKRDALNTFRNKRLAVLSTQFSNDFVALDCTRSVRSAEKAACRSEISAFLTTLKEISLELRVHFHDAAFPNLVKLKKIGEEMYASHPQVNNDDLEVFAAAFAASLDEMAQNFR